MECKGSFNHEDIRKDWESKSFFNLQEGAKGAMVSDKEMVCQLPHKKPILLDLSDFCLKGAHNLKNAAAAALAPLAVEGHIQGFKTHWITSRDYRTGSPVYGLSMG